MFTAVLSFIEYLGTGVLLLTIFVYLYARTTPYKDFALIEQDNLAVAVALAGAVMGFTLPLVAAIYYTKSLLEMVAWSAVTCLVQLGLVVLLRSQAKRIEEGHLASSVTVAAISVAIGLLNAVSISV
jgi:putative membrane protein